MTPASPSLILHEVGHWRPDQVQGRIVASTWPDIAELEDLIDRTWRDAQSRGTIHLFDGAMCRLESVRRSADTLTLEMSQTSYKRFYGTNLTHPEVAARFGPRALARPAGVSAALISADQFLMLGRRNAAVAYYPNRLHPFAGSLEPDDQFDVFAAARRELNEELSLHADDVRDLILAGIVEDTRLGHPELIVVARCTLACNQIADQVHRGEHHDAWSVLATADALAEALRGREKQTFTPVARGAMLLFGRTAFGEQWFRDCTVAAVE
jgi:8-oxo-dGTP pyrophosphatase MutT (NUDIX family)